MLQRSWGQHTSRRFVNVAIALLLGCGISSAQSTTGTVVGTIKDATGGAVPGADVYKRQQYGSMSWPLKEMQEIPWQKSSGTPGTLGTGN